MITKLELIEYLKHTPENTNYNILYSSLYNGSNKEAVDEFIEVLSRGNLSLAALQPYLAKLYEDDKTISPEPLPPFSSGGSVPKPLTYDYMPEGYPKKSVQTTTLMEEQALEFALNEGVYVVQITNPIEIVEGQTYAVNWDGTEYECVCFIFKDTILVLGNLSIMGAGDDTGEPFAYAKFPDNRAGFSTLDTSASHTISVKKIDKTVTPMSEEFLPSGVGTTALITYAASTNTYSSDLTYDELHERLLGGKQVVLHKTVENEYLYLTKWAKESSGKIDLAFAGDDYSVSLNTDGTIVKKPIT